MSLRFLFISEVLPRQQAAILCTSVTFYSLEITHQHAYLIKLIGYTDGILGVLSTNCLLIESEEEFALHMMNY